MNRKVALLISRAILMWSLLSVFTWAQTKQIPPAPIPTQISTAKRVFIANGGGDDPGIDDPLFSGGIDRSYNQFYAAMKSAGRYELVGSPAEADLLFEIRFAVETSTTKVFKGDTIGPSLDPQFRMEIRDPKTNTLLWAFTEHVQWAILQGNRNRNFDQASARIVADVLALGTRALAATTTPAKP
ncbi:MAG TPA: hypothetical protein VJP02_24400 [Candidatus Sulfotelmatobacter sp.]|nr:hypothetical protein [Candidatus Sulfotelmatobacter sp.]